MCQFHFKRVSLIYLEVLDSERKEKARKDNRKFVKMNFFKNKIKLVIHHDVDNKKGIRVTSYKNMHSAVCVNICTGNSIL